ncbi:MAG: dihydrolipoyl dehydrogenase [Pseudomonadota bacterium]|nr:dihydrolipoyl dehydrogenase [Pseudomonadota bacterium]
MSTDRRVDVAIIGAGTSGLNAMAQARRAGKSFVLINGGHLGTTCARVGCMPSKAFIQVAEDFHRREVFDRHGIVGEESLNFSMVDALDHVRDMRDIFVDRVMGSSTDDLADELIDGYAHFLEPTVLEVNETRVIAGSVVIATGSRPIVPTEWEEKFCDHILTTDDIFEQETLPESIAVIGLGVIGLELGQSLSRFGLKVTGIDQVNTIARLSDPVVASAATEILGKEFPLVLGQPAAVKKEGGRLRVTAGDTSIVVEKILASMGRVPNLESLKLGDIGVELDAKGMPRFDPRTMQIEGFPIFLAGDISGERPILHEAGDEGKIAGYNASHDSILAFRRKTPLSITFSDPNIVQTGMEWSELAERDDVAVGEMRMGPVGRALIMAKNKGVIRVYAEKHGGRLLGASLIAPKGENLGHLLAWSIQQRQTVFDLLRMPFYHPVIEEALQAALYNLAGNVEGPQTSPIRELELA